MVASGDWLDEGDTAEVARVSFTWAENQNFIMSSLRALMAEAKSRGWVVMSMKHDGQRIFAFE